MAINMGKLKLGIVGCGAVGGTLANYLEDIGHEVLKYDPLKGLNDSLDDCYSIFICVPVPVSEDSDQDESMLIDAVSKFSKSNKPIFIRSTIVPGTIDKLRKRYQKYNIYHLPEFLTERTADMDILSQKIHGDKNARELLELIFGKDKVNCSFTSKELELAKYTHNCFGALKVSYFNMIYDLCEEIGCDYEKVREVVLASRYINPNHTKIALDGKRGYGGKCFPNNMKNFIEYLDCVHHDLWGLLFDIDSYNESIRE